MAPLVMLLLMKDMGIRRAIEVWKLPAPTPSSAIWRDRQDCMDVVRPGLMVKILGYGW